MGGLRRYRFCYLLARWLALIVALDSGWARSDAWGVPKNKGGDRSKPRPCPSCHGSGGHFEVRGGNGSSAKTGRRTTVWVKCNRCGGSGYV